MSNQIDEKHSIQPICDIDDITISSVSSDKCTTPTKFEEPILKENPLRFVLFPIHYHKTWKYCKEAQSSTWFADEIDFTDDKDHYINLSDDEKMFINNVLAFFAASDGIVNENLMKNLMNDIQIPEARAFYAHQLFIESVHSESYSLMIDVLVDPSEKDKLFHAITDIPIIKKMSDWAIRWMDGDASFAQKLIAFACIEGILFSGPFCAIFWLKKQGKMPGLCYANELISRDEGLHTLFAAHIYSDLLVNKEPRETVLDIVKQVVELEQEFINESLPCSLIGMNKVLMSQYIQFVADRLLQQLGYDKYWNVSNPFPWMELISIDTKTNFFEKRVSEYSIASASKQQTNTGNAIPKYTSINLDDDF